MTTSTTPDKNRIICKATIKKLAAAVFWLAVWQVAAVALRQEILLASPVSVIKKLCSLLPQADFWQAVMFSFSRIISGFLLACVVGVCLAALSARFTLVRTLAAPLIGAIKSTPVASFIILVLLWVPSKNLAVVISFLMVTPIIYTNTLGGISSMDKKLSEMALVFRVPFWRRLRCVYLPQIMPYFRSACAAGLGLCWKAGIAAEVIGLPNGSIGERLYEAKIYLETPELFAWTLVIILVSLLFERIFLLVLDWASARLERA